MKKLLTVVLLLASVAVVSSGEQRLSASEARQHVGEQAKVCGVVASARYAERTRGR